jgi:hypothetical protein
LTWSAGSTFGVLDDIVQREEIALVRLPDCAMS